MFFGSFEDSQEIEYVTSLSAISGLMLTHIRKAMNIAQADMGKLFNMSHATYRSIEKGETAINADFIFMLCGIIEKKFSFYFELLEDIANHLTSVKKDPFNNECIVNLIPNGDFQKLLNSMSSDDFAIAPSIDKTNILIDQDMYLFLSPELKLRMLQLTDKVIMKDQVKEIIKITSDEVEDVVQALKRSELDTNGLNSVNHAGTLSSASAIALYGTILNPLGLPILAGLGLYKAYKKSKEQKKK